jgi:hypothetical protein
LIIQLLRHQHQQFLQLYLLLFRLPIHKSDLRAHKEQQVPKVRLVLKALKGILVPKEQLEHKVPLELRELQVPQEILDHKDQQVLKVQ